VLQPLASQRDPRLIVGLHTSDDAAVYRLSDSHAIIQTVDFFTPIVDDPWTYGAIAAANSMSDIYAMGGEVLFTLNVAGFPTDFPEEIISRIFAGGAAKVAEANAVVAGGHTVTADEPLYGMSVTGQAHPDAIWTKAGAQESDALYLTKPLGTGVISTALKNQVVEPVHLHAAVESMLALNRLPVEAARSATVHACTDITGYGLLGHGFEMASKSSVRFEIFASEVPLLDGATLYAQGQQIPGGLVRNRQYFMNQGVRVERSVDRAKATLLFDPQTSGGLLFSVPGSESEQFEAAFRGHSLAWWKIGSVRAGSGIDVRP
jgi:selenide,water dikinase